MPSHQDSKDNSNPVNVLLIGPPNIGKSVIFNRITGMDIGVANYAGTTIEYTAGRVEIDKYLINLIDVPGTYSLNASNEAEKVAVDMLKGEISDKNNKHCHSEEGVNLTSKKPAAVICVLDALNLESSLHLLLQVLNFGIPVMAVINRIDLIQEQGTAINYKYLEGKLNIPIIPTIAVKGEGINNIENTLAKILNDKDKFYASQKTGKDIKDNKGSSVNKSNESLDLWKLAEEISGSSKTQVATKEVSLRQKWGELLIQPWPGLPLAFVILLLVFGLVVGVGMGLRQFLLLPLFRELIIPAVVMVVENIIPPGVVQRIFIGEYGFLVKGLEWPFTLVLPYVISFYAALSLLEDSGYLPRLGSLLDGLLNKIGLQGSSVIPLLLGYGCGIPAIMATRSITSYKERITISTLVSLSIPCVAQSGALIALLAAAENSVGLVIAVFFVSFTVIAFTGLAMDRILKGEKPYTLMEIPEFLLPRGEVLFKKIWLRIKNYVTDGALPMVGAVGLAAFLYETGIMAIVGRLLEPLIETWLLLPEEAAVPLVLGVMRRELTVLPLLEMQLTTVQLFTGAIVGLFYVPCIAIVATLAKEFNLKTAVFVLILTTTTAFLIGGILARVGGLIF
ncbi:ferrous iron transporter B [Natranaerofaba carboxydovora]|uniref:ferrous iron transporter B n=1 Tax=Natranaerofaba carboxydovora TaxID=2742683 RepID=UPI001F148338|nr:ferrous iron transporter B [Natranaerofaba carboxydovora]UMZ72937.1 Fe(2+) transporter FeoB [Natranaerofaba carboxydovora]